MSISNIMDKWNDFLKSEWEKKIFYKMKLCTNLGEQIFNDFAIELYLDTLRTQFFICLKDYQELRNS